MTSSTAAPPATDSENVTVGTPSTPAVVQTMGRRALADVSPNVPLGSPTVGALKASKTKPMAGSPLKRSFTAMRENGTGFMYLKKRRLSEDGPLNRDGSVSREGSQGQPRPVLGRFVNASAEDVESRPQPPSLHDETPSPAVPAINEPEPSPTEPNTPSSGRGGDAHDSSAERKSFSSLINYDPSSQPSNLLLHATSRAEMLQLRLKVAMYKVRTNQIDIPFAELKANDDRPKTTSQAVEEAVAQLRREAQEHMARSKPVAQLQQEYPKLQSAPLLQPTAYNSRVIHEPSVPSSPPAPGSPDRRSPVGESAAATPQRPGAAWLEEAELTSSIVKGKVAEGLLGLRNAT